MSQVPLKNFLQGHLTEILTLEVVLKFFAIMYLFIVRSILIILCSMSYYSRAFKIVYSYLGEGF
jgi:hypothetical protein